MFLTKEQDELHKHKIWSRNESFAVRNSHHESLEILSLPNK